MPVAQVLTMIGGVALLLLLDVVTRRSRYLDPQALIGALALAAAWLAAAYFRGSGLTSERVIQAILLGALWFMAAAGAGVLLRRSAIRATEQRK
jgi:hypothetical protein